MDNKSIIPFNLEAFKAGQKALTRDGCVASFVGICENCSKGQKLVYEVKGYIYTSNLSGLLGDNDGHVEDRNSNIDLVSMVSRHQHLINSYDPEDTWQASSQHGEWETIVAGEPMWFESSEYRIHPHNDLIKAHRNGAKIEVEKDKLLVIGWADTIAKRFVDDPNPTWDEDKEYRIKPELQTKPEPQTKTIYEWMVRGEFGYWHLNGLLLTEDEAAKEFAEYEYKKTGRSWKVEV